MPTKARVDAHRGRRRGTGARAARDARPQAAAASPDAAAAGAIARTHAAASTDCAAEPRNHRELAEAILTRCDPVQIGCELLASSSEKGASVRARVFETLVNWQFGKTGAAPANDKPNLRIIWDLPCPPHEREYFGPSEEIDAAGETEPEVEP